MAKNSKETAGEKQLFTENQADFYEKSYEEELEARKQEPVTCLGIDFENDDVRREHFTNELREKLKDPEFRKIEGFPISEDENILALSDPPFYTACPNPWISKFIEHWESEKESKPEDYSYHREPFAADVSEGKNEAIYKAHAYHTKVPHKAIMRYILHYTEPGDLIFDGFCGTGMTGVAALLCGDRDAVMSLGYQVHPDGTILREEISTGGETSWEAFSSLGVRRAFLNDLSPAATFISYNYIAPPDAASFEREANRILEEVKDECGWMFETSHRDGSTRGQINYTVWSDVFTCPECAGEVIFSKAAVDKSTGHVSKVFPCPNCDAPLTKKSMERAWSSRYDESLHETIREAKRCPVLINYSIGKEKFEKEPDKEDLELLSKIESSKVPYAFPTLRLMEGKETRRNDVIGITHMHHFYFRRGLWALGAAYERVFRAPERLKRYLLFTFQQAVQGFAKISRYVPTHFSQVNQYLSGTLYVGSQVVDISLPYILSGKIKRLYGILGHTQSSPPCLITTQDSSATGIPDESLDYIFVDPPFGANLNYSELNFLWESWFGIWTDNKSEAIENSVQGKGGAEYRQLMTACFVEAYRVLKPGRWMTVEFSNTKASVWNSIQTALIESGFIVANVSALDKKQGSFKAVTTPTAVKQDLVISAYKPDGGLEMRFQQEAQTEEGVWDFVRSHLKYLPVTKYQGTLLQVIPERDPRILFDQVVVYFVRKGFPVPLSSQDFQVGLSQRFVERDGMFFLPEQTPEYDRKRMSSGDLEQISLFVSDESSAIDWLRQLLKEKPQAFSDINPQFMQHLGGWSKNEAQLDLRELLTQNFITYDGTGPVPEQIHAYLSTNWKDMRKLGKEDHALQDKAKDRWYVPDPKKSGDLEKVRERGLLKEFEEYVQRPKKFTARDRFRKEVIRAGFKKAYQERDYATIIAVAEKIPNKILEEDQKLLMWYDQAITRTGGEG